MARQMSDFGELAVDPRWRVASSRPGERVWTDDFSNLLGIFDWGLKRAR